MRTSVLAVATGATLLLSLGLVAGRETPILIAVLLLGAIYVIPEGDRAIPAPIYAGALLVTSELAFWSLDERELEHVQPGTVRPRLLGIVAVAATGVAAGELAQLASRADIPRSSAGTAAGMTAILACIAVLALLARSRRAHP